MIRRILSDYAQKSSKTLCQLGDFDHILHLIRFGSCSLYICFPWKVKVNLGLSHACIFVRDWSDPLNQSQGFDAMKWRSILEIHVLMRWNDRCKQKPTKPERRELSWTKMETQFISLGLCQSFLLSWPEWVSHVNCIGVYNWLWPNTHGIIPPSNTSILI
jgi:hypothetical protein